MPVKRARLWIVAVSIVTVLAVPSMGRCAEKAATGDQAAPRLTQWQQQVVQRKNALDARYSQSSIGQALDQALGQGANAAARQQAQGAVSAVAQTWQQVKQSVYDQTEDALRRAIEASTSGSLPAGQLTKLEQSMEAWKNADGQVEQRLDQLIVLHAKQVTAGSTTRASAQQQLQAAEQSLRDLSAQPVLATSGLALPAPKPAAAPASSMPQAPIAAAVPAGVPPAPPVVTVVQPPVPPPVQQQAPVVDPCEAAESARSNEALQLLVTGTQENVAEGRRAADEALARAQAAQEAADAAAKTARRKKEKEAAKQLAAEAARLATEAQSVEADYQEAVEQLAQAQAMLAESLEERRGYEQACAQQQAEAAEAEARAEAEAQAERRAQEAQAQANAARRAEQEARARAQAEAERAAAESKAKPKKWWSW